MLVVRIDLKLFVWALIFVKMQSQHHDSTADVYQENEKSLYQQQDTESGE